MNGPTGIMIASGKGVMRTMLCDPFGKVNLIPCDMAINVIVTLAWKLGIEKPEKTIYVNATTNSVENSVTWSALIRYGKIFAMQYPFSGGAKGRIFRNRRFVLGIS